MVSGVADDLFRAAAAWIGRVPGGLGMATALAGAGFGAICGSSTASAATLSSTSLPAMLKQGYEPKMASGVVAISGTLSMLLPTSAALVIYGLLAEVNIGKLLVSGIIPAILVTLTIMATILFLVWQDPSRAPSLTNVPMHEKLRLLKAVGPMLVLFGIVTTVIYTGIATPTEASASGAFALAIWRGRINRKTMVHAFTHAAQGTCMITMILVGASIFGYFFTRRSRPRSGALVAISTSRDGSSSRSSFAATSSSHLHGPDRHLVCGADRAAVIKSLGFDRLVGVIQS